MTHTTSSSSKLYRRPISAMWWTQKWPYTRFILREFSSLFVAAYAGIFLLLIRAVAQGPGAYAAFLESLKSPIAILFHAVALVFVLFHCYTWFKIAPMAFVIPLGEKTLPGFLITAAHYLLLIVVSIILAVIIL